MHPPGFRHAHRLSDWPDCRLEVVCCRGSTVLPIRMLIKHHGDLSFQDVIRRLRCTRCRGWPNRIYLCAGHRDFTGGAPPDWSIELISPRRPMTYKSG
jgi:hypothetical protein